MRLEALTKGGTVSIAVDFSDGENPFYNQITATVNQSSSPLDFANFLRKFADQVEQFENARRNQKPSGVPVKVVDVQISHEGVQALMIEQAIVRVDKCIHEAETRCRIARREADGFRDVKGELVKELQYFTEQRKVRHGY